MPRDATTRLLPADHRTYPWLAALAAVVMVARMASTIHLFTPTFDEPYHLGAAVGVYEAKQHVLGVQHPALPRLVAGLPVVLAGFELPEYRDSSTIRSEGEAFHAGFQIQDSGQRWSALRLARIATLVFAPLSLLYLYRLARFLMSGLVAMLSVVFFSLDPSMLAHGALVTTDAAACAGFLVALYYGVRWLARPTWRRTLLAGAGIGFALACKFSTVLVLPSLALILLMRVIWKRKLFYSTFPSVPKMAAVALGAFVSLWATYLFDVGPIGDQDVFAHHAEWQRLPWFVKETPVPMPSFFMGLMILYGHNKGGHQSYLNGELITTGPWYFFPEVLLLKEPVGLLAAFALALAVFLILRRRAQRSWIILLPAAVFLLASMQGNIAIGVRHVLPLVPLLYLFACFVLARGKLVFALVPLVLLTAVETAVVHPDYLAFFNVASGGSKRGDRYLVGSDLDWGQDIGRLATWLKSDEAAGRPYSLRLYNSAGDQLLEQLGLDPAAATRAAPGSLFAISASVKRGLADFQFKRDGTRQYGPDYTWLDRLQPVKRIGASIEVYDLTSVPTTAPAGVNPPAP